MGDGVLKKRIITGALLIIGLIGIVWLDMSLASSSGTLAKGAILALFCAAVVVPLLAAETCQLAAKAGRFANYPVVLVCSILMLLAMWLQDGDSMNRPLAILALSLLLAFIACTRDRSPQGVIASVSTTLFAIVYSGVLLGFWLMLRSSHDGWVILGAILTVKMGDIGAFATGCSIGRTPLIPWLSPKKTWEGLLGGIIAASVLGGLLALASQSLPEGDRYPVMTGVLFGAVAAVIGLLGDLIGSAMKRDAGAKDSGSMLPGLGGVIDILDSLLLVGPVAWWMLR